MITNFYHLSYVRKLRTLGRKVGILNIFKKIIVKSESSYEEAFYTSLKNTILPGDTIWDIGANVGLYTNHFLNWSGPNGKVIAFEPLPKAFDILSSLVNNTNFKNRAILKLVALADKPGNAMFTADSQDEAVVTTAHIIDISHDNETGILVEINTADRIVLLENIPIPTVVKIDVEGFEEDVLKGGNKTFSNSVCKHLFIEMHFSRMDERNLGDSAARIVGMLRNWGYKIKWVDASHLHAYRK